MYLEDIDGSIGHQKSELVRNFEKMYSTCTGAIATVYVIDTTKPLKLSLKGLIRYNKRENVYKISPSQAIFNNKIKKEGTKIQTTREKVIERLGVKRNKIRETQIRIIKSRYKILEDLGSVTGSKMEDFL